MKQIQTPQLQTWTSDFGESFTDRWDITPDELNKKSVDTYGVSTHDLFKEFISNKNIHTVLEVGCNTGRKLEVLAGIGNYELYGIDPQKYALEKGKIRQPSIHFVEGTAFHMPFADNFFDLVYTYEVLIHIHPDDLLTAMKEIVRVSKKYILHMEYFSPELTEVEYRGKKGQLWKRDFENYYLQSFPYLKSVMNRTLEWNKEVYGVSGLTSKMFLLEKIIES